MGAFLCSLVIVFANLKAIIAFIEPQSLAVT